MVDDAVDKDKPHNSSAKDAHLIFVGNREYTVWNNFVKRSDALLYVLPAALLTFRLPFGSVASHLPPSFRQRLPLRFGSQKCEPNHDVTDAGGGGGDDFSLRSSAVSVSRRYDQGLYDRA